MRVCGNSEDRNEHAARSRLIDGKLVAASKDDDAHHDEDHEPELPSADSRVTDHQVGDGDAERNAERQLKRALDRAASSHTHHQHG